MSWRHKLVFHSCKSSYNRFIESAQKPEESQRNILTSLGNLYDPIYGNKRFQTYEDFSQSFEKIHYHHIGQKILEQKRSKKETFSRGVERYEPTSGSTDTVKWIPYTSAFKNQLDFASGAWIYDLMNRHHGIHEGKHFWSLSWIPNHLRGELNNDDLDVLPWYKKIVMKPIMALDSSVTTLPSIRLAQLASILALLTQKVSLISVWSPTFLIRLINLIEDERDFLLNCLKTNNRQFAAFMGIDRELALTKLKMVDKVSVESLKELFPHLCLVSCWDTSTSSYWASKLKSLFPHVHFQGKGLWATEGVVSIPFQGKYPIAINSHFYEFEDLGSGEILPSWKIEKGQKVSPLISTGSGLFRYQLPDECLVKDFFHNTPTLEFIGRIKEVDLAGEKMAHSRATEILKILDQEFEDLEPLSLVASKKERTYKLLASGSAKSEEVQLRLESLLCQSFHYQLARDMEQLEKSKVEIHENVLEEFYQLCYGKKTMDGNIKLEPLVEF